MAGIGHNQGPELGFRTTWRRHCWTKARRDLLPNLPIEVLRGRVRRAREIGLDYKTYATVRASSGRDIVAYLFSTNALRLFRQAHTLAADRVERLSAIKDMQRHALVIAPLDPQTVLAEIRGCHGPILDTAVQAPNIHASWSDMAVAMDALRPTNLPADAILLIGDTNVERDWSVAGRHAGYLDAAQFFTTASP